MVQTDLPPLPYDAAAAVEAQSVLGDAVHVLEVALESRLRQRDAAIAGWQGMRRIQFDQVDRGLVQSWTQTIATLRETQRAVARELAEVREINHQRALARRLVS